MTARREARRQRVRCKFARCFVGFSAGGAPLGAHVCWGAAAGRGRRLQACVWGRGRRRAWPPPASPHWGSPAAIGGGSGGIAPTPAEGARTPRGALIAVGNGTPGAPRPRRAETPRPRRAESLDERRPDRTGASEAIPSAEGGSPEGGPGRRLAPSARAGRARPVGRSREGLNSDARAREREPEPMISQGRIEDTDAGRAPSSRRRSLPIWQPRGRGRRRGADTAGGPEREAAEAPEPSGCELPPASKAAAGRRPARARRFTATGGASRRDRSSAPPSPSSLTPNAKRQACLRPAQQKTRGCELSGWRAGIVV